VKRRILLGFIFAILLLIVLISAVGSRDIFMELSRADGRLIALSVLSGCLMLFFRGLVWGQFLSLIDRSMPRRRIGRIFLTAMFVKYITPYGQLATEPFVAYLVSSNAKMDYENGLASIISADLLNYLPYYTFGFLALGMIGLGGTLVDGMLSQFLAFGGLFVLVILLVVLVVRRPEIVYTVVLGATGLTYRLVGRVTNRFDERLAPDAVRERLDGFYSTVDTITADRRTLLTATLYAHLGMIFLMLPIYFGGIALGYQIALPVVAVVVALGKLGSVVPAPGGTGGVETIVTAGLTTLSGLDPAAALTVALIYRVSTYWLTIGLGGVAAAVVLVYNS